MVNFNRVSASNISITMSFPTLSKCQGKSIYQDMKTMQKELYQNLVAFAFPNGKWQAGFLGILMIHDKYF